MKAHLLQRGRDVDLEPPPPANAAALKQDLELETLFDAMARGDEFLRGLVETIVLRSQTDPEQIEYRQDALRDALDHPEILRALYALSVEGVESKRRARHFWYRDSPDQLRQKSLRMLELLAALLGRLRALADEHAHEFRSDAFRGLFATLRRELDDEYLATVEHHLRELDFRRGALISARLGRGNRGSEYVLRRPPARRLRERLAPGRRASHSFTLPARDEHGMRALAELHDRGVNRVASALAQSVDHILGFFAALRAELGFYVGCVNLHEQLHEHHRPTCFPAALARGEVTFAARGLYDPCLAFHLGAPLVGNDVVADGKTLVLITGANQGGKSTFLRSVGLAQLMMQAGMFVPAESFRAGVSSGVFTHFKREEDPTMTRGKLDEELARMSEIADAIGPGALLLCNESFASTNEREGSEIARQVVDAMTAASVRVFFVTHLFDLADSLHRRRPEWALFLRAERRADGSRTFRVLPGAPLPTSHGVDSYRRVFGIADSVAAAPERA